MPIYKILSTNQSILAHETFVRTYYPNNWELVGESIQDIEQPQIKKLTKLEYMERFTDLELQSIYTAAKTSVAIEVWLEKFKATTQVDLNDSRILTGLQALETAGLLAPGRAQEIIQ